jgi:hypothetical protein
MSPFERLVITGMRFILWRLVERNYGKLTDNERTWMKDTHLEITRD